MTDIPSVPPPREPKPIGRKSAIGAIPPRLRVSFLLALLAVLLAVLLPPAALDTQQLADALGRPGNVLVLTAHPDDEAMFFAPTILSLRQAGWNVTGLCLSNGNSEGLGYVRRHELTESYAKLGVSPEDVVVIDHPLLQDDMANRWPEKIIADVVSSHLQDLDVNLVVTFDRQGISEHPNHASLSTYRPAETGVKLAQLSTPHLAVKYTGPLASIAESILQLPLVRSALALASPVLGQSGLGRSLISKSRNIRLRVDRQKWWQGVQAMRQHKSQLVWFRWLYLAASQMMWANTLVVVQ